MHLCFVQINTTTKVKYKQSYTNPKRSFSLIKDFINCGACYAVE
jgi:hypothetical protein